MSHTVARAQNVVQKEAGRLASGRRLISAADDSAGKAVEVNLEARVRSRKVAQRNTEYARLKCQTALGGLNKIQDSMMRLETLTVQAANDSLTDKERAHLQVEVDGILTDIDDIAVRTRLHHDQPLLNEVPIDIGFLIDRSGSMSGEITAVKQQIDSFTDELVAKGFNIAFGLGTVGNGDPVDSFTRNEDIGSPGFKATLNSMLANGGGSMRHYSAMINAGVTDHSGTNEPDLFSWRGNAHKYLVVVTDTRAQEGPPLLPGNPSQADVAADLDAAGITVHVIGGPAHAGDFTTITTTTGGSYTNVGNVAQALSDIEDSIESQVVATDDYIWQTGIDNTEDDRVLSGVALDATKLGLEIDEFHIGTREEAVLALDDLSVAFDNLNQAMTTYATLENKLGRLSVNTATMIQSESQSLATIKDADFAESSAEYAMGKVRTENSMNVLRLYGEMKTSLVNNLLDAMNRSVQGGVYAGLV